MPSKKEKTPTQPSENKPVVKAQRTSWTAESTEALLEVRFSDLAKRKFNTCKTTKQKNEWWTWLASRLSLRLKRPIDYKQVQNRYSFLKAEYRALVSGEKETGNDGEPIKYPDYWETLVQYFQVLPIITSETAYLTIST